MRYAVCVGKATRPLVLALWLVAAGACTGLPHAGERSAACWPHFPYESGWLGGDGGYSISLSPTRALWLFGDTFVGADGQADRAGAAFIHNSIAISECSDDGRFDVRFVWGRGLDGAPRAFLERGGEGWWWLFGCLFPKLICALRQPGATCSDREDRPRAGA
jgi:hypothetical protein